MNEDAIRKLVKCSGNAGIPHSNRRDFAIDFDDRIIEFDDLLSETAFEYLNTLMSSTGGTRQYTNDDVIIGIFRLSHNDKCELNFYMDRAGDRKPIKHGKGIALLSKCVCEMK